MNKKIEIKKVPVAMLIEALAEIYENNVDYINIIVEKGPKQDSIWLVENDSENQEVVENKNESINFEDLT